ncbi:MAG TPA: hypothetical protein VME23_19050 [Terracidiphilus sp.]|nr:hypothetical protein [Terracidiphilus sp.]
MKIGRVQLSGAAVAVLGFQLALVVSIAGKYLYERETCPRVWTRAAAYDPEMPMRGRYLSTQLEVDGCGSTLPSAAHAQFPRDINGAVKPGPYKVRGPQVSFEAKLRVENNRLVAVRLEGEQAQSEGLEVWANDDTPCDKMHLRETTDFFLAEHAPDPLALKRGQELWIEVTLPPKGAPRPIQLAIKDNGVWKPLGYE